MKTFFIKTRIFWIVTRILFLALYIGSAISSTSPNIFISILFLIVSALMLYITVREFSKKSTFRGAKIFLGVFSILIGGIIAGLILYMGVQTPNELFLFLLPLWCVMYGLWEIYSTKPR